MSRHPAWWPRGIDVLLGLLAGAVLALVANIWLLHIEIETLQRVSGV